MKAIIVFYDSLNKRNLPPYNPACDTIAPNFTRLANHSVRFNNSYVGSMPCIPDGGNFIPAGIIFCTGNGGRWSRSTIHCRKT